MQHHTFRNPEPARAPGEGKREVQLRWQDVGEVVQGERRLIREDALLFRPEPDRREVFMVAGREVDDAVDATPDRTGRLTSKSGRSLTALPTTTHARVLRHRA